MAEDTSSLIPLPDKTKEIIGAALHHATKTHPIGFNFKEYREKNKSEIFIFCLQNPQLCGKKTDEIVIEYIWQKNCVLNDDQLEELYMKYFISDHKK
jgi:hypothetical protein